MEITIENYQRIEEIKIKLTPGINLITGASNNGKSSSLRAIRDFIFNKFSNDKIRHGEKETVVSLDSVKASRTKDGTKYCINGEEFEKVGRNQLKEVFDIFEIGEIVVNGVSIKPNFWFQLDKPFLFDKTPGQKNDLIIGSKNDKYLKALKSIKNNQNYLSKTEKKSLEDSINLLKKQNLDMCTEIERLEGVEDLYTKICNIEKEEEKLKKMEILLKESLKLEANIEAINKKLDSIETILEKYEKSLNSKIKKIKFHEELNKIIEDFKSDENEVIVIKSKTLELTKNLSKGGELEKKINIFNDEILNYKEMAKIAKELIETRNYVLKKIKERDEILLNSENTISEFEKFKKEIKICPTCDRRFDDNDNSK